MDGWQPSIPAINGGVNIMLILAKFIRLANTTNTSQRKYSDNFDLLPVNAECSNCLSASPFAFAILPLIRGDADRQGGSKIIKLKRILNQGLNFI